jgi:hypothetical protein
VHNTWSPVSVHGTAPTPHAHAAGAALSSFFWLTAGAGSSDETWVFNFTTDTWTQKASFPESGSVQDLGAAAYYFFGLPLLMTYGGAVIDPTTQQPVPITDFTVGRFQGVGGVNAVDDFPAGSPNLVVPHLVVPEPGSSMTFTVDLSGAENSGDVTIPLSSTNPAEGTVSPAQLVFTPANANTPQTITITGGNDTSLSSDLLYQIQYGPIVSSDPDWNGLTEFVPVIARDIPVFTVGAFGSFALTTHGYMVTQSGGSLPSHLSFDSTTNTISGTPDPGTAQTYPLTFQGAATSTTLSFDLVVQPAPNPVPTLSNINPNTVTVSTSNTTITLTGANFVSNANAEFNGTPIPTIFVSDTQLNALIPATDLAMAGTASITVVNPSPGGGASGSTVLTINSASQAPMVTTNPTNQTVQAGQPVTLNAAASGTPSPSVQWQISTDNGNTFANIDGAVSTTLSLMATGLNSGAEYRAVFTNVAGQATSAAATLTVTNFSPVIISQPVNVIVKAGRVVTLSVDVNADPAATVQWQRAKKGSSRFKKIARATSTTLSFTAKARQNGERFRVVIKNSLGTTESVIVILTVV